VKHFGAIIAVIVIAVPLSVTGQNYQSVFICPDSFATALAPLIDDAESDGWQVDIFTLEYIESNYPGTDKRERIKAAISDLSAHGLQIVSFVGDADYSGGEPEYDIIPLWYYDCPEIGYWRQHRATMFDYVDYDGDRVPDVAWTWIPAHAVYQVVNLVAHSLYYEAVDPGSPWLAKCLWLVEDEDLEGNSGEITRRYADSLMNDNALSRFQITPLYDSDIPSGYFNREDSAVAEIDAGVGAVFGMGTVAHRTNFVEFMCGYFYFDVHGDLAENNMCGVYFGLCCGLGEFDRPDDPARGPDFCSQFLFDDDNKGASFWVGPSGNTRYLSNYYFGLALAEQFFELGARTTAEACFLALRRVMREHPEFQEVWEGHNFFGSPFHIMHGMREVGVTHVDDVPQLKTALKQNYPNPFNPSTKIEYSLASKSRVRLAIYNVAGQRVKVLIDEDQNPGHHHIYWDGFNARKSPVSSGIYFYRLTTGSFASSRKMLLLR
jgi:hypothetical protein